MREYPRIDEPVVTVNTRLIGASSEVIESQVTKPLEDSIAGIDGVDILTSISRAEQSQITVRFKLEKNPDDAAADVRDRVSRVRGRLPDAVDEPVIAKVEADATPTIWLAFTQRDADRRWRSPTSSTASSSRACRRCPAWPTCRSAATASSRCASGSTPTSWPPTG